MKTLKMINDLSKLLKENPDITELHTNSLEVKRFVMLNFPKVQVIIDEKIDFLKGYKNELNS